MLTTIDSARSADIVTPAEIRARFPALARRHAGHPARAFGILSECEPFPWDDQSL